MFATSIFAILILCNGLPSLSFCFAEPTAEVSNQHSEQELIRWLNLSANNSKEYRSVVRDLFRHHYDSYYVDLCLENPLAFYGKEHRFGIYDASKRIQIADLNLALRVLHHFGNDIRRLYIAREFSKGILENVTAPLEWVKYLRVDLSQNASNVLPFAQLFPELSHLSLRLEGDVDYSFIDCEVTTLQHLDISVTAESWKRKDQIEGMLWQNQHVESFEFGGFPADYIKNINAMLPNVVNLTLHGFDTGRQIVQLDNVKHLTLYGTNEGAISSN